MHKFCYNRVSGQFGGSGSPSRCQKFRQHFMSEISATTSKIRFFWRKNCKNWHFRMFILGGKGVRLVRNFFLGWSTLVSSKTPWQTKNTSGTSPAHWESILTSQDRKRAFFPSISWKFIIFGVFLHVCREAPWHQKFLPATNRAKYTYMRGALKTRQHLTPQILDPKI